MIQVGSPAPDFRLANQEGKAISLSDFAGRNVLLIFYPGDNTPVCTKQLCEYRDNWDGFRQRNVVLLGISTDSVDKHRRFSSDYAFPFPLLADPEKQVCRAYDALSVFGMARRAYVLVGKSGKVLYSDAETLMFTRKRSEDLLKLLDDKLSR